VQHLVRILYQKKNQLFEVSLFEIQFSLHLISQKPIEIVLYMKKKNIIIKKINNKIK